MKNAGFIDLGYSPRKDELVCLFYAEPQEGKTLSWVAEQIAGESSVGTWVDVKTAEHTLSGLAPHVFEIEGQKSQIKVAYPLKLFEPANVPSILSSVCGNIYGMKACENLRLLDVTLPKKVINAHKGPVLGVSGVRKLLKVKDRPLIGTIIKPKLGLPYKEHARVAYEAWVGGCDIVKDDENLTSQDFNPFKKRVVETLKMRDKAEKKAGERKLYLPNVSAEAAEMCERADFVKKQGGEYIMVDVVTVGFSGLQYIRTKDIPIHAHRAMHAMLTRNPRHGMTMLSLAKFLRLVGVDTLHVGTGEVGKMEGGTNETKQIAEEIRLANVPAEENRLEQEWGGIKPVFPVASGGLHPAGVPDLVGIFGNDVVIQAGGGVHGHPDGTKAGATAMRQAVEAVMEGTTLGDYAITHSELKKALEKFR